MIAEAFNIIEVEDIFSHERLVYPDVDSVIVLSPIEVQASWYERPILIAITKTKVCNPLVQLDVLEFNITKKRVVSIIKQLIEHHAAKHDELVYVYL